MKDMYAILIALVMLLPAVLIMCIWNWCIGRKLKRMLERLYSGDWSATEEFDYDNVAAVELCGPLTQYEVQRMACSLEADRREVRVTLLRFWSALVENYEFRVSVDFAGTDAAGVPFTLQREGVIGIGCGLRRGHLLPCITWVQTERRKG